VSPRNARVETAFLVLVIVVGVAGFWNLYLGPNASPDGFHHLHLLTSFAWLGLLLLQVRMVGAGRVDLHRRFGRAVLALGPLLVASTALLSVRSASRWAGASGGDPLLVQNAGVTIELGMVLLMAFLAIDRPRLHGAWLLSSALFFLGIALVFTLVGFVPAFQPGGSDGMDGFVLAAITASVVVVGFAVALFARDVRNGWPYLLVAGVLVLNGFLGEVLRANGAAATITRMIGGWNPYLTFAITFAILLGALLLLGVGRTRRTRRVA